MHSEEIMNRLLSGLDKLEKDFHELASSSEFEGQRKTYLQFEKQLNHMTQQIKQDLNDIPDIEGYTSILDTI